MQEKKREDDRSVAGRKATALPEEAGGSTRGAGPRGGADSPKDRVKFLCSYGGRIVPRRSDGYFKYVGGDTRVLVASRSVSFKELKKTIQGMFRADVVIKYQLAPLELDVLVTVAGEEDLVYMFEEYDQHYALPRNSPPRRFRLYIFPTSSVAVPQSAFATALDQPSDVAGNAQRSTFTISSFARTSPDYYSDDGLAALHGVRSTPNLGGGGSLVHPTGHVTKGSGGMNQCQHQQHYQQQRPKQYVHWQRSPGVAYCRQQQVSDPRCGDPRRTTAPPVRNEVCRCCAAVPTTPPALRGGHHYPPAPTLAGHGGCVCVGNAVERPTCHPQKGFHTTTTTAVLSSPSASDLGTRCTSKQVASSTFVSLVSNDYRIHGRSRT